MKYKRRVRDIPDGNPIAGARTTITRQDDGITVGSAVSDADGWVEITANGAPGNVWIETQRGSDRYFDDSRSMRPFGAFAPTQLAGLLNTLHGDGILPYGDQFALTAQSGSVLVGTGAALMDGTLGVWYTTTTVTVSNGDRALAVLRSGTGKMELVDVAYASLTASHVPIWRYTVSGGSVNAITSIATPILLGIVSRHPTLQSVARLASGSTTNDSGEASGLSTTLDLVTGVEYQVTAEASAISKARAGAIALRIDGNTSSYVANGDSITTTLKNAHARTITGAGSITIEMYDRSDEEEQPDVDPVLGYDSQFGSFGSTDGLFKYPQQLAVDSSGNIYVADYSNNRLQKFNSSGVFQDEITALTGIRGVAVDGSGNIYLNESFGANNHIRKYNSSFVLQWVSTNFVEFFRHICTDGTHIYTTTDANIVRKRLASNGSFVVNFGSAGPGNGQFNSPYGIATDGTYVYVADQGNTRIQKFTTAGTYVTKWGSAGTGDGQFGAPSGSNDGIRGIAYDAVQELVYVVDQNNHRVQSFTPTGTFVASFGGFGSGNGQFNLPSGIAVNAAGDAIYVSDAGNHRVQKFALTGGSEGGTFPFEWSSGLLVARAIPRS